MTDILALLIAERDRLNRAIEALQATVKRRGRPPKNPLAVLAPAPATPRKGMSATARKSQSERMKKYWACLPRAPKRQARGKTTTEVYNFWRCPRRLHRKSHN